MVRVTPHIELALAHMLWVALQALAHDCLYRPMEQGTVLMMVLMCHCMPGWTHSSWQVQGLALAEIAEVHPALVPIQELGRVHTRAEQHGWA